MSTKPKVIAIVGPTASGKSALAVALARKFGGEVISADSRQVYTGLDVGTGKVTKREMEGIPHHLLDVADPKRQYSVARYTKDAQATIQKIITRGHIPVICGGTGFYVDALLLETQIPEVKPNQTLRKRLGKLSTDTLFSMLKKKDPARAKTIDPHNKVRLIRALEIVEALGKVPEMQKAEGPYDVLWIGLALKSEKLKKKIHDRLLSRMKRGMVSEAKRLHTQGLSWKRMEELGLEYRYLGRYVQGKISKKELLIELEKEIWHYVKRQMTWFKRNKEIQWFEATEIKRIEKTAKNFLAV